MRRMLPVPPRVRTSFSIMTGSRRYKILRAPPLFLKGPEFLLRFRKGFFSPDLLDNHILNNISSLAFPVYFNFIFRLPAMVFSLS